MKNLIRLSALLLGIACAACSHPDDNQLILNTAQGYLDAMGNYRPADARKYASQETQDITLSYYEEILKHTDPKVFANNMPATITIGQIDIDDTLAMAKYHKSTPITEQDGQITLVKRKGEWQVFEVINIPSNMQLNNEGFKKRTITDEQIKQMRQNKKVE